MYSSIIQMHGTPNQNRIYIIRITKRQKKKKLEQSKGIQVSCNICYLQNQTEKKVTLYLNVYIYTFG